MQRRSNAIVFMEPGYSGRQRARRVMSATTGRPVTRSFALNIRRSLIRGSLRRQILLAVVVVNVVLIAAIWALFLFYDYQRNQKMIQFAREDNARKVQKFRDVYIWVSPASRVPDHQRTGPDPVAGLGGHAVTSRS